MLDEMSDILEKYCEEWDDLGMRHTFMQRVPLECWQGRFSKTIARIRSKSRTIHE